MSEKKVESVFSRFIIMGCCSLLLHAIIAAIILQGGVSEKPANVYRVELKYLNVAEHTDPAPAAPEIEEMSITPETMSIVDLTWISAPVLQEPAELPEETIEILINAETTKSPPEIEEISIEPTPLVENVIITPDAGLGAGMDNEEGGGNSLLAAGTERGWGGATFGEGWGGGSGSPGSGGGTGGGSGGGMGNRQSAGGEPVVYYAGMPGITHPVYERAPQPPYPEASRSRGEHGDVLLKVEVLKNGRVGRVEVEKTSGYARLDETALRAVRNWRFKPALKGREIVACWVNIPIKFSFNDR